jgi:hypothetical protein
MPCSDRQEKFEELLELLDSTPSHTSHSFCMHRLRHRCLTLFTSVSRSDRQEKGEELMELLDRKTAREQQKLQQYQTGGAAVREHCPHLTKEACRAARRQPHACHRLHQRWGSCSVRCVHTVSERLQRSC